MSAEAIEPNSQLRAPFPWFGGKSRAASLVWDRLGDVPNYVEPFAGSLAILLRRPTPPRVETVNDRDVYLSNFWRALQFDRAAVAHWADWPVNEADLHARHAWLVGQAEFRERMLTDPDYFDAKIAGWWVWGICQWIGSGWCSEPGWIGRAHAGAKARGIQAAAWKRPVADRGGRGFGRQLPDLAGDGGASGRGIHATGNRKKPALNQNHGNGLGVLRTDDGCDRVASGIDALSERLRYVRVCCGDWSRVVTPAVTTHVGLTGVLLDPPYADTSGRCRRLYREDCLEVAHQVRLWAIENGDNPQLRIALCGLDGEHEMPSSWGCVAWTANGGYANRTRNQNRYRERIWFSPHCLGARQPRLFAVTGAEAPGGE